VVAAVYLHLLVRDVAGRRPAWLATLAYLAFPLAQFYSRSAHVDFAATALGHAMLHHGSIACRRRSVAQTALATLAGTVAVMIKAPAVMPLFLTFAIAVVAWRGWSAFRPALPILALPTLAFALWWRHVEAVNQAAPDWSFLPGYYKGAQPPGWYFGTLEMRLELANWIRLARRVAIEMATPLGAGLALLGGFRRGGTAAPDGSAGLRLALVWLGAAVLYLLTFFQLNLIHNYYQIPLLAPLAFMVGLGADVLIARTPRLGPIPTGAAAFAAFLVVAAVMPARLGYYRIDWLRVTAGRLIEERVPRQDLVVACDHGSGFTDPRLLFRADRSGWSLAIPDLDPERVRRLADLGARWVAVVTDPGHPGLAPPEFLASARAARVPVEHGGRSLGTLDLYDLARWEGAAVAGRTP
jgi:hypothetical protein